MSNLIDSMVLSFASFFDNTRTPMKLLLFGVLILPFPVLNFKSAFLAELFCKVGRDMRVSCTSFLSYPAATSLPLTISDWADAITCRALLRMESGDNCTRGHKQTRHYRAQKQNK